MAKALAALSLLCLLFTSTLAQPKNCNCVAFRLDDIQDFYLTLGQKTVMDTFASFNAPLTLGIIAGSFGLDINQFIYVLNAINTPSKGIDVALNGWLHEDWTTLSLANQTALLTQSVTHLQSLINRRAQTFVPPFNRWNADLISALKTGGFDVFSASVALDPPPYDTVNPSVWRFPYLATTGVQGATNVYGSTSEKVISDIRSQIANFGYAVVLVQPMEFLQWTGTAYDPNNVNATSVNMLSDVLSNVTKSGITITTLRGIKNFFAPNSPVPPPTAPFTLPARPTNILPKGSTVNLPDAPGSTDNQNANINSSSQVAFSAVALLLMLLLSVNM